MGFFGLNHVVMRANLTCSIGGRCLAIITARASPANRRVQPPLSWPLLGNLIGGNTDSNFPILSVRGVYPAATVGCGWKADSRTRFFSRSVN
jgi:hypothetical protein